MRFVMLILSLYIVIGCSNTSYKKSKQTIDTIQINVLPAIGDILSDSIRLKSNNKGLLISSSQLSPSTIVNYKGSVFNIAWDKDGKVNFIVTSDSSFRTNEKAKVNMTLREIKDIQKIEIFEMPGWGYYIKLESGWFVEFCVDKTCTGRELVEYDKVTSIFKK